MKRGLFAALLHVIQRSQHTQSQQHKEHTCIHLRNVLLSRRPRSPQTHITLYSLVTVNSMLFRRTPLLLRSCRIHLRTVHYTPSRSLRSLSAPQTYRPQHVQSRSAHHTPPLVRWASSKAIADEKIEEITELYATAKDEFEIAAEETEKATVYAEEDRKAAREELDKVQAAYRAVVDGPDQEVAEEVRRRIGQRIRELEQGIKALEEMAMNQD